MTFLSLGERIAALRKTLAITQVQLEELFGESSHAGRGKRVPMSQLERSIGRSAELPRQKQKFLMEMLDTVLAQAGA